MRDHRRADAGRRRAEARAHDLLGARQPGDGRRGVPDQHRSSAARGLLPLRGGEDPRRPRRPGARHRAVLIREQGRAGQSQSRDTMTTHPGSATTRLTMAQAVVRYLQAQYSERDGRTRRLIPAMFGIFGHGNVCGIGQALEECGRDLPYYQPCNEQSMVHTALGFAKANRRLATLACTASIGPGSTNMITGAATATINRLPVLLFPSDTYAT